jgi:hypothetical protein
MTIENLTNIKFVRPYERVDAVFEICEPADVYVQGGGTDAIDSKGNAFQRIFHSWRSIFDRNTKIIIGCTIKFDDGSSITGNFDMDELIKGNVVRTE